MWQRTRNSMVLKLAITAAIMVPLMAADCEDSGSDFSSGDVIDIIFAVADAIIRIIAFAS